jgi:hypothetical protein
VAPFATVLDLVPRAWTALALALIALGVTLGIVGSGTVDVIAFGVGGLGGVLGAGIIFYVIGRSEDVERDRERQPRSDRSG